MYRLGLATAILTCLSHPLSLAAMPSDTVTYFDTPIPLNYGDKNIATLNFITAFTGFHPIVEASQYPFTEPFRDTFKKAATYWTDMLGPHAQNTIPWEILINNEKEYANASAQNLYLEVFYDKAAPDTSPLETPKNVKLKLLAGNPIPLLFANQGDSDFQSFIEHSKDTTPPAGKYTFSIVTIGDNMGARRDDAPHGWAMDTQTILPTNEEANDYAGTIRHELGHALGIGWERINQNEEGQPSEEPSMLVITKPQGASTPISYKEILTAFADTPLEPNHYNYHLIDQRGHYAKPGMPIVSTEGFALLKEKRPELTLDDVFLVDHPIATPNIGKNGDNPRIGHMYFIGNHLSEVLDGATFQGVEGLPVNAWEWLKTDDDGQEIYILEGSHLQTSGMMSHRPYSNYTSFMEAELAVMQDLGYIFDRKAYFGYSVYKDGATIINKNGFSARNPTEDGYLPNRYSEIPLGVGLHVYGSQNTITQKANILTKGEGAVGVRIDGLENTLIIPSATQIHADGYRGKGILISYGRNQTIVQAGTVTANGQGGVGLEFNFGSSSIGAIDEYRGSYIRYQRQVSEKTGEIIAAKNLPLEDMNQGTYNVNPQELNGPLVKTYTLQGELMGQKHAIYIGRNAFVKEINIEDGAHITGNITSDWKHFDVPSQAYNPPKAPDHPLTIQYNLQTEQPGYNYTAYIPELVTQLNFRGIQNYGGDISGSDNLKIAVQDGTTHYAGYAKTVNVKVHPQAALYGGTYALHAIDAKLTPKNFTPDKETGTLYNQGTIGAETPSQAFTASSTPTAPTTKTSTLTQQPGDTYMNIKGNLDTAKGTLRFTAIGTALGRVAVDGAAVVDDLRLSFDKNAFYIPNHTYSHFLTATQFTGQENMTMPETNRLLKAKYTSTHQMSTAGNDKLSMGSLLFTPLPVNELPPTYSPAAKNVYQAIASAYDKGDITTTGTPIEQAYSKVYSRLFNTSPIQAAPFLESLASPLPAEFATQALRSTLSGDTIYNRLQSRLSNASDSHIWAALNKQWTRTAGNNGHSPINGHSFSAVIGADLQDTPTWLTGAFFSHETYAASNTTGYGHSKDYRLGAYARYGSPEAGMLSLVGSYGSQSNTLHLNLSDTLEVTSPFGHFPLSTRRDSTYHSHLWSVSFRGSKTHTVNNQPTWNYTPYFGFEANHYTLHGYREEGPLGFSLHVPTQSFTSLAGVLGTSLARRLPNGTTYGIEASYRHFFRGATPVLDSSFGTPGGTFKLEGADRGKNVWQISLHGEKQFHEDFSIHTHLDKIYGHHYQGLSASLEAIWRY